MATKSFGQQFGRGFGQTFAPTAQETFMLQLKQLMSEPERQADLALSQAQTKHLDAQTAQLEGPNPNYYTHDQFAYMAAPSGDPAERAKVKADALANFPPEKYPRGIPKDAAHVIATNARQQSSLSEKQNQADQKAFTDFDKNTNPAVARRGTLLGTMGTLNSSIDKGIKTLSDPNLSPQEKQLAVVDLARVVQQGAPQKEELGAAQYKTMADDIQRLKTYFTGKPGELNQPEVVAKLIKNFNDYRAINNKIVRDNYAAQEITNASRIAKNPDQYAKHKATVLANFQDAQPQAQGAPAGQQQTQGITATGPNGQKLMLSPDGTKWVPVQ